MRPFPSPLLLLLLAFGLAGCLEEKGLAERSATGALAQGPDCRTCHAYPLADTNHRFHVFYPTPDREVNGPITCLDCHSTAIASSPHVQRDSVYRDSIGNEWTTADLPAGTPGRPTLGDTMRAEWTFVRVDTFHQERPVPAPDRPGSLPLLTEYVTGLAHMNGRVDVVFHPRVTDTSKFPGLRAEYNPRQETCSAVACHPAIEGGTPHWRFASPAKGLRELVGGAGHVP